MAEVLWEETGRIRILTMNRPEKKNALTPEGRDLLGEYLIQFRDDDEAWALVITGSGGTFSTGMDLSRAKEMLTRKKPPSLVGPDGLEIWKPIIAAIEGYAVGGGLELALACDVRIAGADAKLGLPEVKRGLIPGVGGIQRMVRAAPFGDALRLLMTGEFFSVEEAHRLGVVQEVVDEGAALERAVTVAEQICSNAPLAVRAVKEAAYRGVDLPIRAALVQDQLFSFRNKQTEDAKEGPRAFVEKRPPNFTGR